MHLELTVIHLKLAQVVCLIKDEKRDTLSIVMDN